MALEVGELEAVEEILLHIAHAGLDPALLVAGGDIAGAILKPVMAGVIQIAGVEDRRRRRPAAAARRSSGYRP